MVKNKFKEVEIEGVVYIEFVTGGKYQKNVLVDRTAWDEYLRQYHWTAIKKNNNYFEVKTSKDKLSVRLHRVIVEYEYSELDYWGNTIDHINNDPLDNRLINLRIYNSKLNSTNIKSKYYTDNNHLIYKQPNGGYKLHTNIFDVPKYQNFKTLEDARAYRDQFVIPLIEEKRNEMIKKTRDIEFERGLRDKLRNNEKEEILETLKKYSIIE